MYSFDLHAIEAEIVGVEGGESRLANLYLGTGSI